MEVILKEDINKLGHRGDVVKVADGYGRNFLLPQKLAIEATAANKSVIEQMKGSALRKSAKEKVDAEAALRPAGRRWSWSSSARSARTITSSARSRRATSRTSLRPRVTPSTAARSRSMSRSSHSASTTFPVKLHRDVTSHVKVTVKSDQPEEVAVTAAE